MESKIKHLMYVPFTGLGLYKGFRGNVWLKNRIAIFKNFVVPSLKHQTNHNFILWISWRREERNNHLVLELKNWLIKTLPLIPVVFTFSGVCFYDDKYSDLEAKDRLLTSIHNSVRELFDVIGECEYILMTIQPSDDLYHRKAVEAIQKVLSRDTFDAVGFPKGFICNYTTKAVAEYNPETNPPFYTIKFPRKVFFDPFAHVQFTALKKDSGKYKAGTPCPSHEYVGECLRYALIGDLRGFMVGTHGANISTTFSNPCKGPTVSEEILKDFGIEDAVPVEINISLRKKILLKLPFKVQRKLRYWFCEKLKI